VESSSPEALIETNPATRAAARPIRGRLFTLTPQWVEHYSGTVGTGISGWDTRAERSMAMAAYVITPVTTQRIRVR
jgi:hypothetical protein